MTASSSGLSQNKKIEFWRWFAPLATLLIIWCIPCPEGLTQQAWHLFAIFVALIVSVLTEPLPTGAMSFIALALAIFSNSLTLGQALKGFSSGSVWLIVSAFILSISFVSSNLGRRIAYKMLSIFGSSSLGVAYALSFADLIMAPAMPSVTARSGGIILPIVKSINLVMGSKPGESGKKIGDFLIMACFQITPITGAFFLTGMAANPLCAELAKQSFGVEIQWIDWLIAASAPCLVCFALVPYLVYKIVRPTMTHTPEAKAMGREELIRMGPMSRTEKIVLVGFIGAMIAWGTCLWTGLNANAIGIGLVAYLFATGALKWNEVLQEKGAWDTLIWFGTIVGLATGLASLGFIKWMSDSLANSLTGFSWEVAFLMLGVAYIYVHYIFATAVGHTGALYVPFAAVAIGAGAPPVMTAICFGLYSNIMWSLTEYAGGPGPLYYGQNYFARPRFYRINFVVVTVNTVLTLVIGMFWWKLIGLY